MGMGSKTLDNGGKRKYINQFGLVSVKGDVVEINLKGLIIIVGNYGSGKTEVSINLAIEKKNAGLNVRIADLDLVNPYFRTREARGILSALGIEMALPPEKYLQADLPILNRRVSGMIKGSGDLIILDVGGDDAGATVLASLSDAFRGKPLRMLQVINPFRPFTETIEGCTKIKNEIETASKISISGIVGNANIIDETTRDIIIKGYDFIREFSNQSGLPLEFITAPLEIYREINTEQFQCPVLPIRRQLVPPWKKAVTFGGRDSE